MEVLAERQCIYYIIAGNTSCQSVGAETFEFGTMGLWEKVLPRWPNYGLGKVIIRLFTLAWPKIIKSAL